jgi:DNA polymerase I-like protein with 3'-5' exonuclease and polymerase domains
VDIESINSIPVCVGFAFNKYHAISVPLIRKIGKIKLTDMPLSDSIICLRLIDETLRRIKAIGQNFKYDDFKLGLFGFRIPNVYSDTLIKTRIIFPELPTKGQATQASIWTREPYYKEEGKQFNLGKSPTDQLFLYNAKDCAVNFEVDLAQEEDLIGLQEAYNIPLVDYYYNYQMKKHKFYLELENNGFLVDHRRKSELLVRYTKLEQIEHEKVERLVGHEVNVKSPDQIKALFQELGFPIFKEAPTSEDSIVKLLGNHCKGKDGPKKKAILETILEERRIRDQKSRYISFNPDFDGRCKSSFNIIKTETCRSSTSVLDRPVRPTKSGLAFHTISKHGRLAKDIRSMFIPDKGKVFLQADSSQAEARVVFVLAKDWVALEAIDKIDIHKRTAALVLGLTSDLDFVSLHIDADDKIGKESPERFCGKKTRHAGNYDMKKRRFMTEFNTDAQKFEINMSISEWKAGSMLDAFHLASPNIKNVFHADIQTAICETRTIIDPYGGIRIFNGVLNESLFQEAYANIPQRTVSHLVQGGALKIHEELGDSVGHWRTHPINFISENHDSLLLQVPEKEYESVAKIMQKHMTTPIDFSKYCTLKRDYILTIPCDVEVSDRTYGDLTKISKFNPKEIELVNTESLTERLERLRKG